MSFKIFRFNHHEVLEPKDLEEQTSRQRQNHFKHLLNDVGVFLLRKPSDTETLFRID